VAAYRLGFRPNQRKINECDRRTSLFTVQFPAQQSKERKKKLYNITYFKILFAIKEKWSRGFKTYIYSTRQYTRTHIDQYDAEFHPASLEDEFDIRSF